jgi:hypothetical protein
MAPSLSEPSVSGDSPAQSQENKTILVEAKSQRGYVSYLKTHSHCDRAGISICLSVYTLNHSIMKLLVSPEWHGRREGMFHSSAALHPPGASRKMQLGSENWLYLMSIKV